MKPLLVLLIAATILQGAFAPPVTPEKDPENKDDLAEYMEYHRYLNEVVQALESDPEFKSRLQMATEDEVRTGNVAHQLEFVNHNVRTQLDEIKRRELERLRHLLKKQHELTLENELDQNTIDGPSDEHLDHKNPHTFEIEDLKRLIKKVTTDLEKADKQRKEEFKEYEMQKEFEEHQKLEQLENEEQKKEFQKKIEDEKEAKKHHQPLHHPGSKQQLEEVWEKQDHMDQQFDPKVFFMMHDVNGDGVWDAEEVKALFVKELDKMYGPSGPNGDRRERAEEMERMREHVFYEVDRNRDGLIDFHEFLAETKKSDFNQDQGWQPIDENQIYTKNEYEVYERRRLEELHYLQGRGLVDAHGRPIPGMEAQLHEVRRQMAHSAAQQYHHQQAGASNGYQGQGQPPQGYQHQQGYQNQQGYQQQQQGYQQQQQQQGYQQPPRGPPQMPPGQGAHQPYVPAGHPSPHGVPAPAVPLAQEPPAQQQPTQQQAAQPQAAQQQAAQQQAAQQQAAQQQAAQQQAAQQQAAQQQAAQQQAAQHQAAQQPQAAQPAVPAPPGFGINPGSH